MVLLVWDRQAALEQMQNTLAENYRLAQEFIHSYSQTLSAWSEWAVGLVNVAGDLIEKNPELFRECVEPT